MSDTNVVSVEIKGNRRGDEAVIQLSNGRQVKTTLARDYNPNIASVIAPTPAQVVGAYLSYNQ